MPVGWPVIGITHQRDQARVPGAGTKHAIRVKAQGALADIGRQNAEIDAADLGEIARRQRAGDRAGAVPPFQRVAPCAGVILLASSRNNRPVPIVEDVLRLGIFNALNLHQPVNMIAVFAAAEAIIVVR